MDKIGVYGGFVIVACRPRASSCLDKGGIDTWEDVPGVQVAWVALLTRWNIFMIILFFYYRGDGVALGSFMFIALCSYTTK